MDSSPTESVSPAVSAPRPYRPSPWWMTLAIIGWLLSLPGILDTGHGSAQLLGSVTGSLVLPALIRLGVTAFKTGRRELGERALFSPWFPAVAMLLNLAAAAGNHGQ